MYNKKISLNKKNKMQNNKSFTQDTASAPPLWLPRGSIRALITVISLLVFFYMSIKGIEVSETFHTIVVTVVAFYFGTRANNKTEILNETAQSIENTQLKDSSVQNRGK